MRLPSPVSRIVRQTPLDRWILDWAESRAQRQALEAWLARDKAGAPPHRIKQQVVAAYAKAFGLRTLIETGTYTGAMPWALRDAFDRIVTIELDEALWRRARNRFGRMPQVRCELGNSADVLPRVLGEIHAPCLFWLDGHYSGKGTAHGPLASPLVRELELILDHPSEGHVILIDDARHLTGRDGYPTLEDLEALFRVRRPTWTCVVRNDIVRAHPPLDASLP